MKRDDKSSLSASACRTSKRLMTKDDDFCCNSWHMMRMSTMTANRFFFSIVVIIEISFVPFDLDKDFNQCKLFNLRRKKKIVNWYLHLIYVHLCLSILRLNWTWSLFVVIDAKAIWSIIFHLKNFSFIDRFASMIDKRSFGSNLHLHLHLHLRRWWCWWWTFTFRCTWNKNFNSTTIRRMTVSLYALSRYKWTSSSKWIDETIDEEYQEMNLYTCNLSFH